MNPDNSPAPESKIPEVVSYLTLRRAVGIIGLSLPVVMLAGSMLLFDCDEVQGSISKYYHTAMRNVFVGSLCAVALFLWAYKGYKRDAADRKYMIPDNPAGNLAALFALGVAFFPTFIGPNDLTSCIHDEYKHRIIGYFHLFWAFSFFLSLAYFSLILFTKGKNRNANRLYKICGYTILGCLVLIIIYLFLLKENFPQLRQIKPIFWLEALALWAFGISWLVKGKVLSYS
jgi:hypothetical protein